MSSEKQPARGQPGGAERGTSAGAFRATSQYTALRARGQIVGCLYPDGVLRKVVRGSVHRLRSWPGWALDLQGLLEAQRLGAHTVEIRDQEDGSTYTASLSTVLRFGQVIDFGFGRQQALDLAYWQIVKAGQYQQLGLLGATA